MQFWPSSAIRLKIGRILRPEVGEVEPVGGHVAAARSSARGQERAGHLAMPMAGRLVPRELAQGALDGRVGDELAVLLDELERLLPDPAVRGEQAAAHHADQSEVAPELRLGTDPFQQGDPGRRRRLVEGPAERRLARPSLPARWPRGSRRPARRARRTRVPSRPSRSRRGSDHEAGNDRSAVERSRTDRRVGIIQERTEPPRRRRSTGRTGDRPDPAEDRQGGRAGVGDRPGQQFVDEADGRRVGLSPRPRSRETPATWWRPTSAPRRRRRPAVARPIEPARPNGRRGSSPGPGAPAVGSSGRDRTSARSGPPRRASRHRRGRASARGRCRSGRPAPAARRTPTSPAGRPRAGARLPASRTRDVLHPQPVHRRVLALGRAVGDPPRGPAKESSCCRGSGCSRRR